MQLKHADTNIFVESGTSALQAEWARPYLFSTCGLPLRTSDAEARAARLGILVFAGELSRRKSEDRVR